MIDLTDKAILAPLPDAPNFSLWELIRSEAAHRLGIDNTPSLVSALNLVLLAQLVLQPLRDKFGPLTVTSGYRSRDLNRHKDVQGAIDSDHLYGYAADIKPAGTRLFEMASWARLHVPFNQIIVEYPPDGWLHVSYKARPNLNKGQVLLKSWRGYSAL